MNQSKAELPSAPSAMQQFAWHATNGLPVLGVLIAIGAESVTAFILGVMIALAFGIGNHLRKQQNLKSAGEVRLRLGPITPIPPKNSKFYFAGLVFFAVCTLSMLIIDDIRQLTKVAMAIMSAGLTVTFAGLMLPKLRRPFVLVFALSLFVGAALILFDAAAVYREGVERATITFVRTAAFGLLVLVGGLMTTLSALQIGSHSRTPVFDTGLFTQWGFMPWSTLRISFGRQGNEDVLRGTAFNGWTFQMPVPTENMESLRQILTAASVPVLESA
ncbi:MAG: hypothetical protein R3C49_05665 [Planctomycetaceae bacterium]